jgi:hypothetical protein
VKAVLPTPEDFNGDVADVRAGDEPTEDERQTLRKVADNLPWSAAHLCCCPARN